MCTYTISSCKVTDMDYGCYMVHVIAIHKWLPTNVQWLATDLLQWLSMVIVHMISLLHMPLKLDVKYRGIQHCLANSVKNSFWWLYSAVAILLYLLWWLQCSTWPPTFNHWKSMMHIAPSSYTLHQFCPAHLQLLLCWDYKMSGHSPSVNCYGLTCWKDIDSNLLHDNTLITSYNMLSSPGLTTKCGVWLDQWIFPSTLIDPPHLFLGPTLAYG